MGAFFFSELESKTNCVICAKEFKHKKENNFKKYLMAHSENLENLRDFQNENRRKKFNAFKASPTTRVGLSINASSNNFYFPYKSIIID